MCPHGDPTCPCQDGLLCHYEWSGRTPPMICTWPDCTVTRSHPIGDGHPAMPTDKERGERG